MSQIKYEKIVQELPSQVLSEEALAKDWLRPEEDRAWAHLKMKKRIGKVYLVGAGPGDPGLVTLKALRILSTADVILYDNLIHPQLLKETKPQAKLIHVGKRGEGSSANQKEIEEKIVFYAKQGNCVLRLKGGDPFIFGRGGEEALHLAQEKIPFEIIPGITSPIAVPAYAGIPLTHRDLTHTVTFVTGHAQEKEEIDWQALARMGTIVFVMGVKTIRKNMQALIQAGRDPKTPVAVIRWGTYPRQKTLVGKIKTIADQVEKTNLMPPAIIVVGEVVSLREKINWFETRPLFGKKLWVTRAQAQASTLSASLRELGAEVMETPMIEIIPPRSWKEVDLAIDKISSYDWIFFTSVNAVQYFFERFKKRKKDIRDLSGHHLAAVGSSTAKALEDLCLTVDFVPKKFTALGLVQEFLKKNKKVKKILIPRAKEGNEEGIELLRQKGISVDVVTAYENQFPKLSQEQLDQIKSLGEMDLVIFASSSAVRNFFQVIKKIPPGPPLLKGGGGDFKCHQIQCICIGPQTAKTAQDLGFEVVATPQKATLKNLVSEIQKYFEPLPTSP